MIGELERTTEEVGVVYFRVLSMDSCGTIDNNKENVRNARTFSEIKTDYLTNFALCYKPVMILIPNKDR
jgi:hypothetical protein